MVNVYKFELEKKTISGIFSAELDENDGFTQQLIRNDHNISIGQFNDRIIYASTNFLAITTFRNGMLELWSFLAKTGVYTETYEEKVKKTETMEKAFSSNEITKLHSGLHEKSNETPL